MNILDILGDFLNPRDYFIREERTEIIDVEIIEDLSPVDNSEPIFEDWTEGNPNKKKNNIKNKFRKKSGL